MALPLMGTLLSIGVSLVDQLIDTSDNDKKSWKEKLFNLDKEGRTQELEAEVNKLKQLTSVDLAQVNLNNVSQTQGSKWRDFVGYMCGIGIGMNTIYVPLANTIISVANSFMDGPFINHVQPMDIEYLLGILGGMLGLGGMTLSKNYYRKT